MKRKSRAFRPDQLHGVYQTMICGALVLAMLARAQEPPEEPGKSIGSGCESFAEKVQRGDGGDGRAWEEAKPRVDSADQRDSIAMDRLLGDDGAPGIDDDGYKVTRHIKRAQCTNSDKTGAFR
jgi:hypothetical protein